MIRIVDIENHTHPRRIAERIMSVTQFQDVFPNVPLRVIKSSNNSPALWGLIVIMNDTSVFTVNRLFNPNTLDLELVFRYCSDFQAFFGLPNQVVEYPERDQVAAFNDFLGKVNEEFDRAVESINNQIVESGPSWVYDSMLEKVWKFRLGLGGGDAYFSPT